MLDIITVRFKKGGKQYFFDPEGETFDVDEAVIVETSRGNEFGNVVLANHPRQEEKVPKPLRKVVRRATDQDLALIEKNRQREQWAKKICLEKIAHHKLDMKIVGVEYSFEGNKVLFYFTADGRVDFRNLVKDLAASIHARIELRQIGVRDESKMIGGLGICGRPFCCNQFLDKFQPVSIKMAKTQNLSLNPTKISGTCGRLMCCLKYEQDAYEDLLKTTPRSDSFVETPDGAGTITSINLLRQQVSVRLDDDPATAKKYHNSEIVVVRSGRGKRPDGYVQPPLKQLEKQRRQPEKEELKITEENHLASALDAMLNPPQAKKPKNPNQKKPFKPYNKGKKPEQDNRREHRGEPKQEHKKEYKQDNRHEHKQDNQKQDNQKRNQNRRRKNNKNKPPQKNDSGN